MSDSRRSRPRPSSSADATVEFTEASQEELTPGCKLAGRFEIVGQVGRGGMGIILEATDTSLEGLRVALKVLPDELSRNKAARKRLRREALAAIQLAHPNVARLHSLEEDGDRLFLVMEFLDGEDLETVLAERESLPLDEVIAIARDTVAGLSAAHDQGVIHRDIKPANLVYGSIGKRRAVKVADFGISFQIADSMTRMTGLVSAGTLLYCPPEQIQNQPPDARSDQYSLAATLYELLAGEPPLVPPALEHKIVNVAPRPIPGIPDPVNAALLRGLSKQPEERFADLAAFLAALEGQTVQDGPPASRSPAEPTPPPSDPGSPAAATSAEGAPEPRGLPDPVVQPSPTPELHDERRPLGFRVQLFWILRAVGVLLVLGGTALAALLGFLT